MSNKGISALIMSGIFAIIGLICFVNTLHVNDVQNLQVIQSIKGEVTVRRDAGWYAMICPRIWTYAKAGIYQLNSEDKDLLDIQFKNKSTAKLRANIGYRIDGASNEVIIALHQQVEGNDDKIWKMLLTALNTAAQSITTKYDPSDVIGGEKFEPMVNEIYTAIMHNAGLLKHGIDVNYFAVDGRPIPDDETQKQFARQKDADLSRRLAEAEKIKLEAETLKVEANYQMQIAEQRGQAEAQMAKEVQNAEREKKLAEIAAQKQVEVEKLAKEQMLIQMQKEKEAAAIQVEKEKDVAKIQAEKLLAVAEIQKQTEAANLEAIKLQAEQKIASAQAKKQEIELSGAITEVQKYQLEIDMKTKIGVAQAYAEGIGKIKLPVIMQNSSGTASANSGPADAMKTFFDLKNAALAIEVAENQKLSETKLTTK